MDFGYERGISKRRRNILRIDSASIGMESARTFTTSSSMVRKYASSVASKTTTDNFGLGESLKSLDSKIKDIKSARNVGRESLEEQFKKLREEFVNILMRLLFPDKEYSAKESMARMDNGGDSGDYTPQTIVSHIMFENEYHYEEYESTTFSAKGIINCKDGTQIDVNLNIEMSRSFEETYSEQFEYIQYMTDPLVIDFEGNVPYMSDQTIKFDIDMDGEEDEIYKLGAGSGFLALDLNDDGIINDGSELFGTRSGDGFRDLSVYDDDKDGFIDEDDEIFNKLKIWAFDENGNGHLYSLKEKNVGAICLKNVSSEFSLNNVTDNTTKGVIRSTGIFIAEDGRYTGGVHHLDVAIRERALAAYA